jgi:probable F420-dependent oxidoreductase
LDLSGDVSVADPLLHSAFAASITTRIKFGTAVMILPQCNPLYVAKEVASLDLLSGGRMLLGIGSGWLAEEFGALQLDWKKRGLMTDEAIQSLRALWRENLSTFNGKYFNFTAVRSFPKPVQAGGVPILVGGHSPAAVRRAAKFGDFSLQWASSKDSRGRSTLTRSGVFVTYWKSLKSECEKIGRDYSKMEDIGYRPRRARYAQAVAG